MIVRSLQYQVIGETVTQRRHKCSTAQDAVLLDREDSREALFAQCFGSFDIRSEPIDTIAL